MAVKKIVNKKEVTKKAAKKSVAVSKKKDAEKATEIKVVEKKGLGHVRIQTAEGWKRMMKRQHAKK